MRLSLYYHNLLRGIFVSILSLAAVSVWGVEYAQTSVLSSGKWVKVKVTDSGIYQLSRSVLSGWGFSDISKVKVYGYGGAPISERMGDGYVDDLPQVPVYRNGDKLLFYAQGPVEWEDSGSGNMRITYNRNTYSVAGYYFITDSDSDSGVAEFATTGTAAGSSDGPLISDFFDAALHEEETSAPANTSRVLLGEDFRYTSSQSFTLNLPGVVNGSTIRTRVNFMAKVTGGASSLRIYGGGTQIASLTLAGISNSDNYGIGKINYADGMSVASGEDYTVTISYANTGILYFANLDYILVNYLRSLRLDGNSLQFRSNTPQCTDSVFSIAGAQGDAVVWDITTKYRPEVVNTSNQGGTVYFRQTESGKREYVAFNPSATFPSPQFDKNVTNQNLHGETAPTMLIISPKEFQAQAERIARLHRDVDGMTVKVVGQDEIFNEFSSGTPDAMAYRKLAKMWWERTKELPDSSLRRFRYLLLFGKSVYDNRQLSSATRNLGYPLLLTWESEDCTSQSISYNTDDVFGVLIDNSDAGSGSGRLDIAIGRFPVKSVDEAKTVVDKICNYVNNADPGIWKNNVIIIADDGDGGTHMDGAENAIKAMQSYGGGLQYVYNRVYIDAFEEVTTSSGRTYPAAQEKMFRLFRNGAIYSEYIGHANTKSWTHNSLLRWTDVQNEFYLKHPSLMYTGTCEFTRWDDTETSAGELLFLNGQGGVIGLITSARATGIGENASLSRALGTYLFRRDQYGEMRRVGDVVKDAKNSGIASMSHCRKYALIGDPAMRLKYPEYNVVVDEINGTPLNGDAYPEMQARQNVTIKGHVEDLDGVKISNMDGELYTTVYDAQTSVTTNGNHEGSGDTGKEVTYDEWSNMLYNGTDTIRNGEFDVSFKVPLEILNNYREGLINLYAYSSDLGVDANGSSDEFYVYGYDDTADSDDNGPEISLMALNSEDFKDGDNVNETPYLIARVSDESGINISTAGIGHEMTLLLDDKETITGLSAYYSQDSEKNGYLNYQLDELTAGSHTLRLRVWDTVGNASEKTISFNVVNGLAPHLYSVYSDANPAKTEANFYLRHNRPDALVTVTISVYDLMGRAVWTDTSTGRSDMYLSMPVTWDLTDGTGRRVNRGIYLYRATISSNGGSETTDAQRIAVAAE